MQSYYESNIHNNPFAKRPKKRTIKKTWVKFYDLESKERLYFPCYNERDVKLNIKELKDKIVQADNDDDYATDDEVLSKSIRKVRDDLDDALIRHFQKNDALCSDTKRMLARREAF